jgi:thiamine biosynthesis lipoprotein
MATVTLACEAMATRFELVLHGERDVALRGAGEEAIGEIHRIEAALSLYRPTSQISAVNRNGAATPVRVTPEVFHLVERALQFTHITGGAFDITVAPLLRAWGLMKDQGRIPSEKDLAEARACVGAALIEMDSADYSIGFRRAGVMLDLGSIGKGYALDRALDILKEAGGADALLHGGTSTILAMGKPTTGEPWRVAIPAPPPSLANPASSPLEPLAIVDLRDSSLSLSAVWGKGFENGGRFHGHVMDPRLGSPVAGALMAAVVLPSATESDALSTALLVGGRALLEEWNVSEPGVPGLVVEMGEPAAGQRVFSRGFDTLKQGRTEKLS